MRKWFYKAVSIVARGLGLADPRLYRHYIGGPSHAGEAISVNSALQIDTVWACVRLIAQTIATLPLQFYLMDDKGRGTVARDHPLYPLLHDQPNSDMTAVTFWEAMIASLMLWGNCYAMIDRRADGTVVAITPLVPERLTVRRDTENGSLMYHYAWFGVSLDLTEDQVFHVKGFSLDGLIGISPITQARETLGIAVAAEKSAASFFRNAMRPSIVLTSPTYLTDAQRAKFGDEMIEKFTGSINTGRTPLLEGGWTIQNISIKPEDAQLLATRAFSVEQICRWYGVQPVMVGHMDKSTAWGTGLEQMNLWFLTYTLRPILKSIEQEVRRSLLNPVERMLYYAEFNVEGLLRADSAGRATLMKTLVENGLRTLNEERALDNFPPLPGGDDLVVMSNRIPAEILGKVARMGLDKPIDPTFQPPKAPLDNPLPDTAAGTGS